LNKLELPEGKLEMPYQIGLCDDENYQLKVNTLFLKEIASKNKYDLEYHEFTSGKQLRNYLETNNLDALFLDIDLGEETGIEIATWIARKYSHIITVFVTGHREFAVEAFEVDAVGYLVKPYDIKKMENVMKKVITQLEKSAHDQEVHEIVITEENIKKKIDCRDILYIQRQLTKSIIKTQNRNYQIYEPISSLCERIGNSFVRINQGEVVRISLIAGIRGNIVYLKNGMEMAIGRTYRKSVMETYFGK
jgi:DNA-binding LytR/AlgR family response regulator